MSDIQWKYVDGSAQRKGINNPILSRSLGLSKFVDRKYYIDTFHVRKAPYDERFSKNNAIHDAVRSVRRFYQ